MYKILLATKSVIYAPLYLAKSLTLSKEFANIEFSYPSSPSNGSDQLIDELLLNLKDSNSILAVADPMRILFSKNINDGHDKPKVIGSLINKVLLWGIKNYPKNADDIKSGKNVVFVHPEGMTMYTMVFNDLYKTLHPNTNGANNQLDKETYYHIKKSIYSKIEPGDEKIWFNPNQLSLFKKVGYVTTEPLEKIAATKADVNSHDFFNKSHETLFTGLVTGEEIYNEHKVFIDGIIEGIKKAVKLIYEDPATASEILLEYSDKEFSVKSNWTLDNLYEFIKEYLVRHQVFSSDLVIEESHFNNSKSEWENFLSINEKINPEYTKLKTKIQNADFTNYFVLNGSSNSKSQSTKSEFYWIREKKIFSLPFLKRTEIEMLNKLFWIGFVLSIPWLFYLMIEYLMELLGCPFNSLFPNIDANKTYFTLGVTIIILLTQTWYVLNLLNSNIGLSLSKSILSSMLFSWSVFNIVRFITISNENAYWEIWLSISIPIFTAVFNGIRFFRPNLKTLRKFIKQTNIGLLHCTQYFCWGQFLLSKYETKKAFNRIP